MAEINLLQTETKTSSITSNRSRRLLARLLMIILIGALLVYGYFYFDIWRTNRTIDQTTTAIAQAQSEALNNKNRAELITRQGQLQQLDTLIDSHLYWSYLLPELARISLKSGKYTAIEADSTGKLVLVAALPSYEELEKFMQIFDLPEYNQQFSNVKILSISKVNQESTVEIQVRLQLTFNPSYIKGRL